VKTGERADDVMPLARLHRGAQAVIVDIAATASGPVAHRLYDLGFRSGTTVDCLRRAPLGSPTVYRVGESDICLRHGEAAHVRVELPR
jgi:ferrous iron transport protein A